MYCEGLRTTNDLQLYTILICIYKFNFNLEKKNFTALALNDFYFSSVGLYLYIFVSNNYMLLILLQICANNLVCLVLFLVSISLFTLCPSLTKNESWKPKLIVQSFCVSNALFEIEKYFI